MTDLTRLRGVTNMATQYVFANWRLRNLPDDVSDFYISCGVSGTNEDGEYDEQWDGFYMHDDGVILTIKKDAQGGEFPYEVELRAPRTVENATLRDDLWLSPAYIDGPEWPNKPSDNPEANFGHIDENGLKHYWDKLEGDHIVELHEMVPLEKSS